MILYIAWELTRRELWGNSRVLIRTGLAIAVVLAATAPFLVPYLQLRRLGFAPRTVAETRRFSADVFAYFTADPNLRLWGSIAQAWPRPEGLLFPGLTIVALALFGASGVDDVPAAPSRDNRGVALVLATVAATLGVVAALLLGFPIRLPGIKITSLPRALLLGSLAGAVVLAASKRSREAARRCLLSHAGIFSLIVMFAVAMSFGPDIHARGRAVADGNIYALFVDFVPGFDGVRVPARYAMIVTLGLAALTALGVAGIRRPRRGSISIVAGALILLEAIAVPIPMNQNSTQYSQLGLAPLPASVSTGADAPEVYRYVAQLPDSAVLIELPLGEPAFDVRYMFYSSLHWRRLVNGYSGGSPEQYGLLTESLNDVVSRPERAWLAIATSTATHVIVHEASYTNDAGKELSALLRAHGAREIAAFGSDRVFELPGAKR